MIPLPVCRWREELLEGLCICHSKKLANSPKPVKASFCVTCRDVDHEAGSLPPTLPCVHLEAPAGRRTLVSDDQAPASQEIFVCALHGSCTLSRAKQIPETESRSCSTCSDYLPRNPFGRNSTQMLRLAKEFLAAMPEYPHGRYHGRGVLIAAGGDRFFPGLYITIRALRHFECRLPIQVWYLGRKNELTTEQKTLLGHYGVEFIDGDVVQQKHPARRLDGWELKVFATLHCSFEEVLFLDADCYPCGNPEFLFDLEDYCLRGAIFWPDTVPIDDRLKWPAFRVNDPHRPGSVESGQFVINKKLTWRPLNLAWHYNDHSDYYYRYCHGDKHTFEVAWTRCGTPFVMWEPKSRWVGAAYLHTGPDGLPLFVHRCADKFRFDNYGYTTPQYQELPRFYPELPLERECWNWMRDLARQVGRVRKLARIVAINKLPRCRWRFALGDGSLMCFSEKLVAPPHRINVSVCRKCPYSNHEATPPLDRHQAPNPLEIGPKPRYQVLEPTQPLRAGQRHFAIGTLYTPEFAELGRLTSQVVKTYAERHGYAAVIGKAVIDVSRHPFWSKLVLVERYLSEEPACAWLMWIDADAVITDLDRRLEEFIDDAVDFLVAEDLLSPINVGVFFVRNCPATIEMLRRAYAKTHYLAHPLPEQMALYEALRDAKDTVRTRVVSRRLFNSFPREYEKGDFVIHFAGYSNQTKLAGVKSTIASSSGAFQSLCPGPPPSERPGQDSFVGSVRPWTDLPPMFCITCSQTPERTALASQHFRQRRLDVTFFPGIHGKTFGLRTVLQSDCPMLGGHIGALLSHYMLWQTLAYLPHEEVLILEDDAWFEPDFRETFERAYVDLPKDWQFVFVGAVAMEGKPVKRITDRVSLMHYPCGLHAYLVKRSILPFLLQTNHEARMPMDLQLITNSFPFLKCYTFTPSLVKQRSSTSPTEGTGENWPTMSPARDSD